MPRKIQRVNEIGQTTPIVNEDPEEQAKIQSVLILLCRRLGQTQEEAEVTRTMYLNEQLCPEDRAELLIEYKALVAQVKEAQIVQAKKQPTKVENKTTVVNPRDPTRIKQRVTVRDAKTGFVVKLEDV